MTPQLLQTLIPLLSFAHLLTIVNAQSATSFTYPGIQPVPIHGQGDAVISENYINLTRTDGSGNPATYSVGRVVYDNIVEFNARTTFTTAIRFQVTADEGSVGDGLAFFIAPFGDNIPAGSSGGSLGIFNSSGMSPSTFAVEFDTFSNGWDPNYIHVGIDIESRTSRNTTRVDTSIVNKEVLASISYLPAINLISVVVEADLRVFLVSSVYNLSSIFNGSVQVGISAATGSRTARHDVFSWSFVSSSS